MDYFESKLNTIRNKMLSNKTFVTLWFYTLFLLILSAWMSSDNKIYGTECYHTEPNGMAMVLISTFLGLTISIFFVGLGEIMTHHDD